MRALGIDPGSRVTGWGVIERAGSSLRTLGSGTIRLGAERTLADRLAHLHAECGRLLATWGPDTVVVERNFVSQNVQSAFRLGEVRGVLLACAASAGLPVAEYAPAAVKLAAVGHGRADKESVVRGITAVLRLAVPPPSDAADALAVALCHLQQAPLDAALARALRAARR